MLCLFKYRKKEYAVKIIEGDKEDEKVIVKFLAKTEGGRGRMPKDREVKSEDLIALKDTLE